MLTSRPVRFGVTLPQIKRTWQEARDAAIEFDRLGFDHLWVCDHVYGVPIPTLPILEAWTQLAAVAAVTERAGLGTLVTPPFFRNPALLAKQVATIDQIAGPGRAIVGLGAGWFEAEFKDTGCAFPPLRERLRALEETVLILKKLWTKEKASFEGKHFSVRDAVCEPKPSVRPQILVGGGGEKVLMGIAARHADIWNNMGVFQGQLGAKIEALQRRCNDVGRDFDSIVRTHGPDCRIFDSEADLAAWLASPTGGHLRKLVPTDEYARDNFVGTVDQVTEKVQAFVDAGCREFVLWFRDYPSTASLEAFATRVMPAVSG